MRALPFLLLTVLGCAACAARPTWRTTDEAVRLPVVPLVVHPDLRFGSGVVIDDRHVLTCAHLLPEALETGGFVIVPFHDAVTRFRVVEAGGGADMAQLVGDLSCEEMQAASADWALLELDEPLRDVMPTSEGHGEPHPGEAVVVVGFLRTADGVRCVEVPAQVIENPCGAAAGSWFILSTTVPPESVKGFHGLSGGLVARRDRDGALIALGIFRGTFGTGCPLGMMVIRLRVLDDKSRGQ